MKFSGIYKIVSIRNPNKIYIGSASNLNNRWQVHLSNLKKNNHHSRKLQNYYNKYGKEDLEFSLLEQCNIDKLIEREQYYIDTLNPFFNICPIASSTLGVKKTPETCKKISDAKKRQPSSRKGVKLSDETKDKLRLANIGKVMGDDVKEKISNSLKNRVVTDKHRQNISNGLKGLKKTIEHIENNRIAQIGKHYGAMSEENKRKISEARKGKPHPHKGFSPSLKTRLKSSKSHLGQVAWNKGMSINEQIEYIKNKNQCVSV